MPAFSACRRCKRGVSISILSRLLFIAYFTEVGLLLVVIPWSSFWDRNYFAESWPYLQMVVHNNFARGAVSGLGVISLFAALFDLAALLPWGRNHPRLPTLRG